MSMEELANHIITVAHDNNLTITNLQLQKILYFTLRNSVGLLDRKIIEETYDEPFLVWRYGPVVKSQYDRFYSYGSSPIIDSFTQIPKYEDLNDMIIYFLGIDVFRMVDASHTHKFWKKNSPNIVFGRSDIKYPLREVLRES